MATILIVSNAASAPTTLPAMGTTVTYASTMDDDNIVLINSVDTTEVEANTSSNETAVTTSTSVPRITAIQLPVFVGIFVGIIALLILLTATIITVLCIYLQKYRMKLASQLEEDNEYVYDYVIERGIGIMGASNPIEMKINEAYGTPGQAKCLENTNEPGAFETQYEEIHHFDRVARNYN